MVKFIFFSFIFHLTLLTVFKLDIVDLNKKKEQAVNVNLSLEKKTIQEKAKPKKEIKPNKTIREKSKPKKEIKPNKTIREKAKPKKEIKPNKTIQEKAKPKKEIKPNKTIQEKAKPKKKTKPNKTISEKVKPKGSNENKFDDLLKDLAEKKLPLNTQDDFEKKIQKLSKQKLNNNNTLNNKIPKQNELNAIEKLILNQIDESWSRPPGIKTSEEIIIKMIVRLDVNGNVIGLETHKNTLNAVNRDKMLLPYLDSAVRAIKKASPFEGLKKDRYNIWKELIINFKPIEAR